MKASKMGRTISLAFTDYWLGIGRRLECATDVSNLIGNKMTIKTIPTLTPENRVLLMLFAQTDMYELRKQPIMWWSANEIWNMTMMKGFQFTEIYNSSKLATRFYGSNFI
jgi:hypothetical protein